MSKANRVEVQKGKIVADQVTSKQMTHPQKVREAEAADVFRRGAQELHLHEPKK